MPRTYEERVDRGEIFVTEYRKNIREAVEKLLDEDGLVAQEALIDEFKKIVNKYNIILEEERLEGITFKPDFIGSIYGLVNAHTDSIRVKVKLTEETFREITLNPRLLLWTKTSPVHTHILPKDDIALTELLCAFSLVGGAAAEGQFTIIGDASEEGFIYDAKVKEVKTIEPGVATDKYKGGTVKDIYTHQFFPSDKLDGIYMLSADEEEIAIGAVSANLYNGIGQSTPAHSQKVKDINQDLTTRALHEVLVLKDEMQHGIKDGFYKGMSPEREDSMIKLGVTGFSNYSVKVSDDDKTVRKVETILEPRIPSDSQVKNAKNFRKLMNAAKDRIIPSEGRS